METLSNNEAVHVYCPASLRLKLLILRMLVSVRLAVNTLVQETSSAAPLGPVQLHENRPSLATVQLTLTDETRLSLPNSISLTNKNVISPPLVMLTVKKEIFKLIAMSEQTYGIYDIYIYTKCYGIYIYIYTVTFFMCIVHLVQ